MMQCTFSLYLVTISVLMVIGQWDLTVLFVITLKIFINSSCSEIISYSLNGFFLLEKILRIIALSMRSLGPHAMFYLAAAVSDFYVPWKSMVMVQYNEILFFFFL